jgi:large subunit ribosomal protein L21
MSYTLLQISGKQLFVQKNRWYDLDFIKHGKLGDFLFFNQILLNKQKNKVQLGRPFLNQSTFPAKIIQHHRGSKLVVLKTKPKKHYTKSKGHQQQYSRIFV